MLCPCPSGESCPGHGMRKVQATDFKLKCTNMWRSFKSFTLFSGLQGSSEVPKPTEPLAERPKAAPPEPTESEASPAARTAPEAWKRWRVQKWEHFVETVHVLYQFMPTLRLLCLVWFRFHSRRRELRMVLQGSHNGLSFCAFTVCLNTLFCHSWLRIHWGC